MSHDNTNEYTFGPHLEEAFDRIDAGLFSGDSFHSKEAIARFRWFLQRWEKELKSTEDVVIAFEATPRLTWTQRVEELEAQGMTRSDAQGVADLEEAQGDIDPD